MERSLAERLARRSVVDRQACQLERQWRGALASALDWESVQAFVAWQAKIDRDYRVWVDGAASFDDTDHYFHAERHLAYLLYSGIWELPCLGKDLSPIKVRLLSSISLWDVTQFLAYFRFLSRTSGQPEWGTSLHLEDHLAAEAQLKQSFLRRTKLGKSRSSHTDCVQRYERLHAAAFSHLTDARACILAMKEAQARRTGVREPETVAARFVSQFYGPFRSEKPRVPAQFLDDVAADPQQLFLLSAFEYAVFECARANSACPTSTRAL